MAGLLLLLHVLGFAASVHAVLTNRTAQGAIAWGISLNTLPAVSLPLYLVFGRQRFEGYADAWRGREAEVEAALARERARLAPFAVEGLARLPDYEALKRLAGGPLLRGNELELLVDGEATFRSIFEGLARAERYALVQFYIVHDDGLGRRLAEALTACARRGVRVYFLYDEIGSLGLPRGYLERLEAAGVQHSRFNTTQGPRNRFQLNFRNHRKSVIVDGREAWIGGHNVGDEYLGLDPEIGPWRDTHLHLVGPAVSQAQLAFVADWYWATRAILALEWEPSPAPGGEDAAALVLPISPTARIETAQLFFVHALNAARERIWLATPYFVPDPAVMAALRLAALRGVDVRVLVPDRSDNPVADLAARWFASELDGLGIRFHRYTAGFLHEKVFLVDDDVSMVGSVNLDNRSFRLQFELAVLAVDARLAREVEAMLRRDLERARPWAPGELRGAPLWKRLAVSVARLAAPLL